MCALPHSVTAVTKSESAVASVKSMKRWISAAVVYSIAAIARLDFGSQLPPRWEERPRRRWSCQGCRGCLTKSLESRAELIKQPLAHLFRYVDGFADRNR